MTKSLPNKDQSAEAALEINLLGQATLIVIGHEIEQAFQLFEINDGKLLSEQIREIVNGLRKPEIGESPYSIKIIGSTDRIERIRIQLPPWIKVKSTFDSHNKSLKILFYQKTGRVRVASENNESQSIEFKKTTLAAIPLHTEASEMVRVLIVDDSPTIRKILSKILDKAHGFEVVGEAADVSQAQEILKKSKVDLMTLDIHMPGMDGVSYLETKRSPDHPPVVMISSVNYNDAVKALRCLELGAVDYIEKPQGMQLAEEADRIRGILKVAAKKRTTKGRLLTKSFKITYEPAPRFQDLIAIGASTGGVEAITTVVTQFPENSPPVVIVQHMPPFFSAAFAIRLNDMCKIKVKEAADKDVLEPGCAYIAPGGKQMKLQQAPDGKPFIVITDDPPVNRHAPSVDYLFDSVCKLTGKFRVGSCLLTGMGKDGAEGLLALHKKGILTIAESEETAVVYGMPKEAVRLNAADHVLPLPDIAAALFKAFMNKNGARI